MKHRDTHGRLRVVNWLLTPRVDKLPVCLRCGLSREVRRYRAPNVSRVNKAVASSLNASLFKRLTSYILTRSSPFCG
jgi:hypothetical protein